MKGKYFFSVLICILLGASACTRIEGPVPEKKLPNIIFILTDDLGYGDVGVLYQNQRKAGGKPFHRTPHLDKMAEEGTLLTRHYVPAPVCAPSRASLLRGVHQGHADVRNNQFDKALSDKHTLASVLKEAGYATAIIGKYGLQGTEGDSPETWEAYPTKRGFDYFFGYVRHRDGHNHYPAHKAPERPRVELYAGNEEISSSLRGCYTTDLFTAMSKKWIVDQKTNNPEVPFFLYLAYNTPHAGLQVASTPYPEGAGLQGGVQWRGKAGSFINTATDTIDTYIHPDYANKEWPDVQKRISSMIRRIDNGIGDVLQLLKDLGIDEETMVVFSSDNGPHHESYGYGDYSPTFFDSYGPLDGTKRDTWEGGIRVPAIVRWPGTVPSGNKNDTPTGFHDWMPTFAQLAQIPAPATTDGVSLVPMLTGEGTQLPGTVYIEYTVGGATPDYPAFHGSHKGKKRGEMQVIYVDGYKGVRYNIISADDDFRIYDTRKDPGEEKDLAGTSAYFNDLDERMKKRVLRLRRPNTSAARPYDGEIVPSITIEQPLSVGLAYRAFEMSSSWVPVTSVEESPNDAGVSNDMDPTQIIRNELNVIEFTGLLQVPETGKYSFHLKTDGKTVMRLHDALVIDADKGYASGSLVEAQLQLEKGYHPIKVVYLRGATDPVLNLEWSGERFTQRSIGSENFFHINTDAESK